jgi:hypothetical protein
LEETVEKLRIIEQKNLELHIVISKINRQGEELQSIICTEKKTVKKQEELLFRANIKIR